ncbi:MAG: HAMP domain-containing histidine kinase [Gemmatimonadetes bacterium]|nr:HAMP domain-containing histidine kinase [Gemmatimonadota bacterium]
MIRRLLDQLDNPRKHLTLLVGLLALVFVLTAVVAWRAHVAERDRGRIARGTLDETAAMALKDWDFLNANYTGAFLTDLARKLNNKGNSLDSMLSAIRIGDFCVRCDASVPVRSVFRFNDGVREVQMAGAPVDPRVVASIREHIAADRIVPFHDLVHGGMYFVGVDERVVTAVVFRRLNPDSTTMHVTGIVLDEATARQMLEVAYESTRFLQPTLAPDASQADLFARFASVIGRNLIAVGSSDTLQTMEASAPSYGLTLAIGPQLSAAGRLQFGADPMAERATVFLLMLVISALMVLALMQVRREAELTRLRADFVSGVSHELRTPLAQIRMFTETLLLGRVRSDVERRRSLEIIDQEARRLAHLVENVLLFSKTEGGRRPRLAPEPTHFAAEIRDAVESFTLLSRNRQVEVRTEVQENITVAVDRAALRQILLNLVDNALKYGPAGQRITVGAALFDDVARLWVDDEGAGIPVTERAHVFESFYRMRRDIDSRVSGSGIGLAVVRELARLHGGDAWAEAAPGRGARIVVQFPDAYLRSDQAGDFAAAS